MTIAQEIAENSVRIEPRRRFVGRTEYELYIDAATDGNGPMWSGGSVNREFVEMQASDNDTDETICSLRFANPLYDRATDSVRSVVIEDGEVQPVDHAERLQALKASAISAIVKADAILLRCAILQREAMLDAGRTDSEDSHALTEFVTRQVSVMGLEFCTETLAEFGSVRYNDALRRSAASNHTPVAFVE